MIKERQTSLAPYLTILGPGRKEAFPFLCARHHPTIIKENCGLCRDQRSLHHYVCLIVQNAQWIDFLMIHVYFPVRFRNDEHSGRPVASCGCPSPMFLVCYKQTKLPARWCPSFVLLLGSRKKNWPALSHRHQASSDSEAPSRVCLSCSCLMAHRKHSGVTAGSGQDKLLPPKTRNPLRNLLLPSETAFHHSRAFQ